MKALVLLSVLPVLVLTACSRVGAGRTCDWQPGDNASPLDFRDRRQGLHLMGEALRAEDLAIRYADVHRGHRSGQYAGNEAYQHAREQCMASLFDALANHHGVTVAQVRDALLYRRASVDALILTLFVAFYVVVANAIVQWIADSALSEVRLLRWVATAVAACGAAAAGLVLFGLWTATFEMIRIGNTHMSYRVGRSPWLHHRGELLIGGVVLFVLLAAYRHGRERVEDRKVRNDETRGPTRRAADAAGVIMERRG